METKTEPVQTSSSLNVFTLVLVVGLTWASGYWAAKSVILSPNGFLSQANVQLGGLLVSFVLIVVALALCPKLVKVSRKRM